MKEMTATALIEDTCYEVIGHGKTLYYAQIDALEKIDEQIDGSHGLSHGIESLRISRELKSKVVLFPPLEKQI